MSKVGTTLSVFALAVLVLLNSQRTVPLGINNSLTEYAVAHSYIMAETNDLHHSAVSSIPGSYVGENVGVGPTIESVHEGFINSPDHYRNIVDPKFNSVGIGVVELDGRVWVTQVFSDLDSTSTHSEALEWAVAEGIISGYTDGTIRPQEPVTRGQLATMLMRMAEAESEDTLINNNIKCAP